MNQTPPAKPAAPGANGPRPDTPIEALIIRNATVQDVEGVQALVTRAYGEPDIYSARMVQGQISNYPDGVFVAELGGRIVGYAASFLVREAMAFRAHTWDAITGGGFGARHTPKGEWLYGMEVAVDPTARRRRIGQRLYDARKRLVEEEGLKGIVFAGRLPGFARRKKTYPTPEAYLEAVIDKDIRDPVVGFQTRNGFEPVKVLRRYLPEDIASGGHAVLMRWVNPYWNPEEETRTAHRRDPDTVRVATVQLQARAVAGFDEFLRHVTYFVDVCADYKCDFVVFPELFTLQLLAAETRKLTPEEAIEALSHYTPQFTEAMRDLALRFNINIIGGSHPTVTDDGDVQNVGYVFLRDGAVHAQEKIHPTPDERSWWNIKGGDTVRAIPTDCGLIGVLICYDSEFPELARLLADEGARLMFVPFCTDNRQGYLRVRYCAQARAIENQCYVVLSGNVGNLPNVENMDVQYAQSAILTPCDFPFARDGVAAEATENVETVTIADLDMSNLAWARHEGTVRNLRDRRFDLYRVDWRGPVES